MTNVNLFVDKETHRLAKIRTARTGMSVLGSVHTPESTPESSRIGLLGTANAPNPDTRLMPSVNGE